jgi:hypothetical protein
MMRMHLQEIAFAVALGTAMTAAAQSPGYPSAAPSTDRPAVAAQKGDSDAEKACANVAASEKANCLAKANKSGSADMKSSDTTTPSASAPSNTVPKSENASPRAETATMKSGSTVPKSDNASPKAEAATSKSDTMPPAK